VYCLLSLLQFSGKTPVIRNSLFALLQYYYYIFLLGKGSIEKSVMQRVFYIASTNTEKTVRTMPRGRNIPTVGTCTVCTVWQETCRPIFRGRPTCGNPWTLAQPTCYPNANNLANTAWDSLRRKPFQKYFLKEVFARNSDDENRKRFNMYLYPLVLPEKILVSLFFHKQISGLKISISWATWSVSQSLNGTCYIDCDRNLSF
jgi:hypothetical protein